MGGWRCSCGRGACTAHVGLCRCKHTQVHAQVYICPLQLVGQVPDLIPPSYCAWAGGGIHAVSFRICPCSAYGITPSPTLQIEKLRL